METSHYRGSVLGCISISKFTILLATSSLALANEPPLCKSYTPGERCLCSDFGITLKTEGLYWASRENHLILGIALAGLKSTDKIPPALDRWNFRGEMIRINPEWNWGLRVGIGYTSPSDYWDLIADWTSFHTQSGKTLDVLQLPAWNPWGYPDTAPGVYLFDLSRNWNLKYDVLDLELGRAFWIGRCLTFRPHLGVAAGWIDQGLQILFNYEPKDFIPFGSILDLKCDFCGAGLDSGFTLHFTNGTGFGVYGKIATSLLYGTFDSSLNQLESSANEMGGSLTENTLIADTRDTFQMGITAFQGILGVNWNHAFYSNRFRLGLNVAWEFNQLNDINKFHHFSHFLADGIYRQEHTSLMLMGLTFGGTFDF